MENRALSLLSVAILYHLGALSLSQSESSTNIIIIIALSNYMYIRTNEMKKASLRKKSVRPCVCPLV
jgi:hypothetical protein